MAYWNRETVENKYIKVRISNKDCHSQILLEFAGSSGHVTHAKFMEFKNGRVLGKAAFGGLK